MAQVAVAGLRPEFPAHTPTRFVALAESCWAADPTARPSFEALVGRLGELLEVADELQVRAWGGRRVQASETEPPYVCCLGLGLEWRQQGAGAGDGGAFGCVWIGTGMEVAVGLRRWR